MLAALIGFISGYLTSIPSGPVGMSVISVGIKKGLRFGLSVGIGAAIMDSIYIFGGLTGVGLLNFSDETNYWIRIFGIIFLFIYGLVEIRSKKASSTKTKKLNKPRKRKYLLLGIMFYISNPVIVVSYTTLATIIQSYQLIEHSFINNIILSVSLGVGTTAWFGTLLLIIKKYKDKFSDHIIKRIGIAGGYILIAVSIYFAYKVFF